MIVCGELPFGTSGVTFGFCPGGDLSGAPTVMSQRLQGWPWAGYLRVAVGPEPGDLAVWVFGF